MLSLRPAWVGGIFLCFYLLIAHAHTADEERNVLNSLSIGDTTRTRSDPEQGPSDLGERGRHEVERDDEAFLYNRKTSRPDGGRSPSASSFSQPADSAPLPTEDVPTDTPGRKGGSPERGGPLTMTNKGPGRHRTRATLKRVKVIALFTTIAASLFVLRYIRKCIFGRREGSDSTASLGGSAVSRRLAAGGEGDKDPCKRPPRPDKSQSKDEEEKLHLIVLHIPRSGMGAGASSGRSGSRGERQPTRRGEETGGTHTGPSTPTTPLPADLQEILFQMIRFAQERHRHASESEAAGPPRRPSPADNPRPRPGGPSQPGRAPSQQRTPADPYARPSARSPAQQPSHLRQPSPVHLPHPHGPGVESRVEPSAPPLPTEAPAAHRVPGGMQHGYFGSHQAGPPFPFQQPGHPYTTGPRRPPPPYPGPPSAHHPSGAAPLSHGPAAAPLSHGPAAAPLSHGPGAAPLSHGSGTAPLSHGSGAAPLSHGPAAAPLSHGPGAAPLSHGPGAAPLSHGPGAAPLSHGSGTAPLSHGPGAAPLSHGSGTAPLSHGPAAVPLSHGPGAAPPRGPSRQGPLSFHLGHSPPHHLLGPAHHPAVPESLPQSSVPSVTDSIDPSIFRETLVEMIHDAVERSSEGERSSRGDRGRGPLGESAWLEMLLTRLDNHIAVHGPGRPRPGGGEPRRPGDQAMGPPGRSSTAEGAWAGPEPRPPLVPPQGPAGASEHPVPSFPPLAASIDPELYRQQLLTMIYEMVHGQGEKNPSVGAEARLADLLHQLEILNQQSPLPGSESQREPATGPGETEHGMSAAPEKLRVPEETNDVSEEEGESDDFEVLSPPQSLLSAEWESGVTGVQEHWNLLRRQTPAQKEKGTSPKTQKKEPGVPPIPQDVKGPERTPSPGGGLESRAGALQSTLGSEEGEPSGALEWEVLLENGIESELLIQSMASYYMEEEKDED